MWETHNFIKKIYNLINRSNISRWGLIPSTSILPDDVLSMSDLLLMPLLMYIFWQLGFVFCLEVIWAEKLKADPHLTTSIRYNDCIFKIVFCSKNLFTLLLSFHADFTIVGHIQIFLVSICLLSRTSGMYIADTKILTYHQLTHSHTFIPHI